jgi:hypothetical protein
VYVHALQRSAAKPYGLCRSRAHVHLHTWLVACGRHALVAQPPCAHLLLLCCEEEDRRERRRKLGLPEELSEEEKAKEAARLTQLYEEQEKKKLNLAVKPISCEQAVLRPRHGLVDDASCGMTPKCSHCAYSLAKLRHDVSPVQCMVHNACCCGFVQPSSMIAFQLLSRQLTSQNLLGAQYLR